MHFVPVPDPGVGMMWMFLGVLAPIVMFLPAVLSEAIVLRLLLPGRRAFWNSLGANLVTTVVGALVGVHIIVLAAELTRLITGASDWEISYYGEHTDLVLPIAMAIWICSVSFTVPTAHPRADSLRQAGS